VRFEQPAKFNQGAAQHLRIDRGIYPYLGAAVEIKQLRRAASLYGYAAVPGIRGARLAMQARTGVFVDPAEYITRGVIGVTQANMGCGLAMSGWNVSALPGCRYWLQIHRGLRGQTSKRFGRRCALATVIWSQFQAQTGLSCVALEAARRADRRLDTGARSRRRPSNLLDDRDDSGDQGCPQRSQSSVQVAALLAGRQGRQQLRSVCRAGRRSTVIRRSPDARTVVASAILTPSRRVNLRPRLSAEIRFGTSVFSGTSRNTGVRATARTPCAGAAATLHIFAGAATGELGRSRATRPAPQRQPERPNCRHARPPRRCRREAAATQACRGA